MSKKTALIFKDINKFLADNNFHKPISPGDLLSTRYTDEEIQTILNNLELQFDNVTEITLSDILDAKSDIKLSERLRNVKTFDLPRFCDGNTLFVHESTGNNMIDNFDGRNKPIIFMSGRCYMSTIANEIYNRLDQKVDIIMLSPLRNRHRVIVNNQPINLYLLEQRNLKPNSKLETYNSSLLEDITENEHTKVINYTCYNDREQKTQPDVSQYFISYEGQPDEIDEEYTNQQLIQAFEGLITDIKNLFNTKFDYDTMQWK